MRLAWFGDLETSECESNYLKAAEASKMSDKTR